MWNAVDQLLHTIVEQGAYPGCAIAAGVKGRPLYSNVFGYLSSNRVRPVTRDTRYDVGALTQVLATVPLCLLAAEQGLLSLDDPLEQFLPKAPEDKKAITIQQLLTHTAGLAPCFLLSAETHSARTALNAMLKHPLTGAPGSKVRPSSMGFFLLGQLLEQIFAMPLDEAAKRYVFAPLQMNASGYLPSGEDVAPTAAPDENGDPHAGMPLDDNARFMHGVAGHAGVFTTLNDIARFAAMLSQQGRTESGVFLTPRSIHLAATERTRGMNEAYGYGFKITKRNDPFLGHLWPSDGYGLQDTAGGSLIAVSPEEGFYVAILVNAFNVPTDYRTNGRMRKLILNAAYAAYQHEG